MTLGDPSRRAGVKGPDEDAVRVPHWAMAALLMFGLHLLWLIWLVPSPARYHTPYRPPTRFSFLTARAVGEAAGVDPQGDARVLWSPILLSLPTPMGFSGAVVSESLDVRPSLEAPPGHARFLERERYDRPPPDPGRQVRDLDLAAPVELDLDPGARPPPPTREPGLTILPMTDGPPLVDTPWPANGSGATTGGDWRVTARLVFGAEGQVRAVFLEDAAGDPAVNRLAARALRLWRTEPGSDGRVARVSLSYLAVPPETRASDERGVP